MMNVWLAPPGFPPIPFTEHKSLQHPFQAFTSILVVLIIRVSTLDIPTNHECLAGSAEFPAKSVNRK